HGDAVGRVPRDEGARELVERVVDECRLVAFERRAQRLERGRARGGALPLARELETRVDACAPDVREIVDVEAREVTRLLGGAERSERRRELLVERRRV